MEPELRTIAGERGVMKTTTTPSAATPARPGAVYPLRLLAQDEVFSGAFSVIRRNPRATLGLTFLAAVLNFLVSLLLLTVMPSDAYLRMLTDPSAFENQELALAVLTDGGVMVLMLVTSFIGTLVMAMSLGLVAVPALRAAYGLPTSLRQTLSLRAGRLAWLALHLVLLMAVLAVLAAAAAAVSVPLIVITMGIGLVIVLPALFLIACWLTAGLMFGPLLVVVERRNAFSAIGRSFALNRGMWWRHIGTVALVYLMLGVVMLVTSVPVGLITGFGGEMAWQSAQGQDGTFILVVLGLAQLYDVVLNTLLTTLIGVLIAMIYLNARFRREALDVMLLDAAETPAELPGSPEHLTAHLQGGIR